jgi:hypothetical protein
MNTEHADIHGFLSKMKGGSIQFAWRHARSTAHRLPIRSASPLPFFFLMQSLINLQRLRNPERSFSTCLDPAGRWWQGGRLVHDRGLLHSCCSREMQADLGVPEENSKQDSGSTRSHLGGSPIATRIVYWIQISSSSMSRLNVQTL